MTSKLLCSIVIISAPVMVVIEGRASAQTTPGSIAGHIYGPDGNALAGTTVWANIVSPMARPIDRSLATPGLNTVSESDGSFTLSGVPAGDYVICARKAGVAALNPCAWGSAPLVKVTAGLQATGQTVRMAAAATLQVHFDDPGGLLAANASKPGANLIVGLATQRRFMPLRLTGSTA